MRVVARALREFPNVNARWTDQGVGSREVNVGSPSRSWTACGGQRQTRRRPFHRRDQRRLHGGWCARRARTKLSLDDMSGGTFTITNLGMYDIESFTPVINLPEAAILGVGKITERPVVPDGEIVIRPICT